MMNEDESEIGTVHSAESSPVSEVKRVNQRINNFKTQLILKESLNNNIISKEVQTGYWRHTVLFKDLDIIGEIKTVIKAGSTVGIYSIEEKFFKLKDKFIEVFSRIKFFFCNQIVEDVTDKEEQLGIITAEHNRAHRQAKEVYKQIVNRYFWPNAFKQILSLNVTCEVCKKNKYDRHPNKQPIGETPIPEEGGERIHADIYYCENSSFLTMTDSFSKYLITTQVRSKIEAKDRMIELLPLFGNVKTLITDNEAAFCSPSAKCAYNLLNITHKTTPPAHSKSNGAIKRIHSTLTELIRIVKETTHITDIKDIMTLATKKYNETIHTVTDRRPTDIFHNYIDNSNAKVKIL